MVCVVIFRVKTKKNEIFGTRLVVAERTATGSLHVKNDSKRNFRHRNRLCPVEPNVFYGIFYRQQLIIIGDKRILSKIKSYFILYSQTNTIKLNN